MTYFKQATAVRGALLAAAALVAACPAPAAQAAARDAHSGNWLYLTVTRGDTRSGDMRGTLLLCDPPLGHAHAAEACAELEAADGDIGSLRANADAVCPMIYAPVTVRVFGQWHGRTVQNEKTFSNSCAMEAGTGEVFRLYD